MKRKVVVTMSLAWWSDDKYYHKNDITDDYIIQEIESLDETTIMENADEATTIKVEITEHSNE